MSAMDPTSPPPDSEIVDDLRMEWRRRPSLIHSLRSERMRHESHQKS